MNKQEHRNHTVEISAIIKAVQLRALLDVKNADQIIKYEEIFLNAPNARFAKTLALFGCDEFDAAMLATCLAVSFQPELSEKFENINGFDYVSEPLIAKLYGYEYHPINNASAALRWQLIQPTPTDKNYPTIYSIDDAVRNWISGSFSLDHDLQGWVGEPAIGITLKKWPIAKTIASIEQRLKEPRPVIVNIIGEVGCGRSDFAAHLVKALGKRPFLVRKRKSYDENSILRLHRAATVANAILIWEEATEAELWPRETEPNKLQIVLRRPNQFIHCNDRFLVMDVDLPKMGEDERLQYMQKLLPKAWNWKSEEAKTLARRKSLTSRIIRELAAKSPSSLDEFSSAFRTRNSEDIKEFGQLIYRDAYWEDIVLPKPFKTRLKSLTFEARSREKLWNNPALARLYTQERNMLVLLHGPPGTGKTLTATVLANYIGRDLLWVDGASMISKYIGETSKNLQSLFNQARELDAIVFIDEADGLIGKRTEVRDGTTHYANADVAYFLQLVESHFNGFIIMATNRKTDLDKALERRITHDFEFTRPDEKLRLQIWKHHIIAFKKEIAVGVDVDLLSTQLSKVDFSAAEIKSVLLNAYFIADEQNKKVDIGVVLEAVARLAEKTGTRIGSREWQNLTKVLREKI